jgi:hypothetical protein
MSPEVCDRLDDFLGRPVKLALISPIGGAVVPVRKFIYNEYEDGYTVTSWPVHLGLTTEQFRGAEDNRNLTVLFFNYSSRDFHSKVLAHLNRGGRTA